MERPSVSLFSDGTEYNLFNYPHGPMFNVAGSFFPHRPPVAWLGTLDGTMDPPACPQVVMY